MPGRTPWIATAVRRAKDRKQLLLSGGDGFPTPFDAPAGAYTRPLLSTTSAVSVTKTTQRVSQ
jgi:hypothetical protein